MQRNLSAKAFIADIAALTVSIGFASALVLGSVLPWNSTVAVGSTWSMVGLLYLGAVIGSVFAKRLWNITAGRPSYGRALLVAATAFGVVAIGILTTRMYWSRPFLFLTLISWLVIMLVYRAVLRARPWEDTYLVITDETELAHELGTTPHANVAGVLAPDAPQVQETIDSTVTVTVNAGTLYSSATSRFIADARQSGSPVRSFTDVYEEHTGKAPIAHIAQGWGAPMLIQANDGYLPFKRLIDILAVIVIAPFALIATLLGMIWVKIDSPGTALYHQPRVGKNGSVFTIYKIRTMATADPSAANRTADQDADRITKAGSFLRRTRIDELPQLWNVLTGDLSIVGPRPEQVQLVAEFDEEIPFYSQRLVIRPGITGWAQVQHGYASGVAETIEKLGYDLFYVKHMSIWLDVRILGRSVWTVVSGFGAK